MRARNVKQKRKLVNFVDANFFCLFNFSGLLRFPAARKRRIVLAFLEEKKLRYCWRDADRTRVCVCCMYLRLPVVHVDMCMYSIFTCIRVNYRYIQYMQRDNLREQHTVCYVYICTYAVLSSQYRAGRQRLHRVMS